MPDSLTHGFERICRQVGFVDIIPDPAKPGATKTKVRYHLHGLRHFMGTYAIGRGFNDVAVAARMGHSNPSTTTGIYAHPLPEVDQAIADMLGQLVRPAQAEVAAPITVLSIERTTSASTAQAPSGFTLVADELGKLAALRDSGVLTDAEFVGQKTRLLAAFA
jgi:hypothetical protein